MAIIAQGGTGTYDEAFISTGTLLRSDGLLFGKVFRRYDEGRFLTFLEANQNWKVLDDTLANWHEKGYVLNNAEVEALVSGGASAGVTAVIRLTDASHYESGARSPFNVGSSVKIGNTHMLVTAKSETTDNAHTLTVKPWDATVTLNTVITAGSTIVPVSKFFAEGSGYQEASSNLPTRFQEQAGIVKAKKTITGTQATNKTKVAMVDGTQYVTYEAEKELFLEHRLDIVYAMLLGPGGTITDANGDNVRAVKGYVPQIEERGNEYTYNSTITLTDINNWTRVLKKEMGAKENIMNEGHEAKIVVEDLMTDVMKDGARLYLDATSKGMGGAAGKQRMIDFGFDGFTKNGYMFYRNCMDEFNNPINTYAADQPYAWYSVITPYKQVKDPVTKEDGFTLQIGYKSAPGPKGANFDRKFQFRMGGDSAPNGMHDSETDEFNMRYLTEFAAVLVCANQSIIAKRS